MKRPESRVQRQARRWMLLRNETLTGRHKERYDAWMAVPENLAEYDRLELLNQQVKAFYERDRSFRLAPLPAPRRPRLTSGRAALAVAATILLVLVVPRLGGIGGQSHQTAIGETRLVTLEDGSTVYLNGASRVRIAYDATARSLELIDGQAVFQVARDPARPFRVQAADRTIEALGTVFDVDRHGSDVEIGVAEGAVLVAATDPTGTLPPDPGSLRLGAGQLVAFRTGQQAQPVRTVPAEQIGTWRRGFIVYREMPFAQVLADLQRRYPGSWTVDDPALAAMPVSMSLHLREPDGVIRMLEAAVPAKAVRNRDGQVRFVPAGG